MKISVNDFVSELKEALDIKKKLNGKKVETETVESDKKGYDFLVTYVNDVEVSREYVKNAEFVEPDGDYTRPFPYAQGMFVQRGYFYTDGVDIWEALEDGVPESFSDEYYFDIIKG